MSNGFEIKDIVDAAINNFLVYPKKYLITVKDPYAITTCPTKGQEFIYEFEQTDFFATTHYGFVRLFQNNVEDSEKIDFSKIKN